MSETPVFVVLLFILRCLIPLAILFGISYLLRRLGLVAVEPAEAPDEPTQQGTSPASKPKEASK